MTKRAEKLEDLHGQHQAKKRLKIAIDAAKKSNDAVGHILLTGPSGCGKSSLAGVIASERGVDYFPVIATSIKNENDIKEILAKKLSNQGYRLDDMEPVDPTKIKPTVIFIDEIHNLNRKIYETLYTVMEDRVYWDEEKDSWTGRASKKLMWVPKFTLIGATTREGDLEKPFLDRFTYKIKIKRYTDSECIKFVLDTLIENNIKVDDPDAAKSIAYRARGTARIAIQLTIQCIDMCISKGAKSITKEIVEEYFAMCDIDQFGLTDIDRRILIYLNSASKPLGLNAIATYLEESSNSLELHYEPFLVEKDLIRRTPRGRLITAKGKDYLESQGLGETLDFRREIKAKVIDFKL